MGLSAAAQREVVGLLEAVAAGRRPREAARVLLLRLQGRARKPRRDVSTDQLWLFRLDAERSPWWADQARQFRPAPALGPLRPDDLVTCTQFQARLLARVCIQRQLARWPGGNRFKDGTVREKRAGVHPYCSSGSCTEGVDHRARTAYDPEADWSKGRYTFFRPGSGEQCKVRRQLLLSIPELTPDIDHPPDLQPVQVPETEDADDIRDTVEGRS